MNTLFILLAIAAHLLAAVILLKHRRAVRHHRDAMRVIGSDHRLTEALHQRLTAREPAPDWRSPTEMQRKIAAWQQAASDL